MSLKSLVRPCAPDFAGPCAGFAGLGLVRTLARNLAQRITQASEPVQPLVSNHIGFYTPHKHLMRSLPTPGKKHPQMSCAASCADQLCKMSIILGLGGSENMWQDLVGCCSRYCKVLFARPCADTFAGPCAAGGGRHKSGTRGGFLAN